MARNLMASVYDWGQDPAAGISGGSWEVQLPPSNMLSIQPQLVAQAIGTSVSFTLNLGATRNIETVHLQRLVTDPGGTVTVSVPGYSTGPVSAWPSDANGVYPGLEEAWLGRQRIFVFPQPFATSTVSVSISSAAPLQVGYIGACEMLESPIGTGRELGMKMTVLDEADIQNVPFGSTYITLRARRRRINLGIGFLRQGGYYVGLPDQLFNPLRNALVAGKSSPILIVPEPDDTANLERLSVWGLSTTDQAFTNPFFATWATAYQVDQLA